ncbi:MAG: hypothetical protein F4018_03355 [Acidobacteria bacterium]|nr:hypothetical protein [Holophagales bacterium]MYK87445.1 hypothetical protein [Acidobacteriota bacterium]
MADFGRSKGLQDLVMSPETYALLVDDLDADLEYRSNLHRLNRGERRVLEDGSRLVLLPSNHMLGASQVALELPDGRRLGYSGDFGWPLEDVIQVDELVVDSTYGSPRSVRKYTQAEAEACLFVLVCERLRLGPVHIRAHRGTIERALTVLCGGVGAPILASRRLIREVDVYRRFGLTTCDVITLDSDDGQAALRQRSYVRLYSKGDVTGNEPMVGTSIACSAFMSGRDGHEDPLTMYSDSSYCVALSNHADFEETLSYVRATGAKRVVTDNTRNHGLELALAIKDRIAGVHAGPSTNRPGPRW